MEKTKGISQFAALIAGSKKLIDDGSYTKIREKYYDPEFVKSFGDKKSLFDKRRAIELGMCGRLVENMCKDGAQPEDYKNVVIYAYLCIDAVKHQLDIFTAAEDLGIKELAKKYMYNYGSKTKEETK